MQNAFNIQNKAISLAPAVDRAFVILRFLSRTREPLGVSAISRALDIGKSTVHGILQALLAAGAIEDTGGRRFRLGPLVEELGRCRRGRQNLPEICQPYLAELVDQMGQTSMLGIPEGRSLRIALALEGRGPFRVKAAQGGAIPLLAGAVGKVALAWRIVPMPEVLPRFTENSLVDPHLMSEELVQVRTKGLAMDRGEYLRGVFAAASPILDAQRVVGIVFTAGFQDQLGEQGLVSLGQAVTRAAQSLSKKLSEWEVGYEGNPVHAQR